ncbi:gag-polypeptide of LTR copia-type [Sesbania bispinosa]|nr:gag-polypeptide of LTR copia-type [Sesbania bispinosa]
MDLSLREEEPPTFTPESTIFQRASREKWEHSNRSISENDKAKEFLRSISEKFKTFNKAQKGQYLYLHEKTKYDGVSGVREHMMKLVHYYNKLKSLKVELGESYLIWPVLKSLPSQFDVLKSSYNTQKEEWTTDEMIVIISQEETSIKKTKSHSAQFIASTSGTKHMKKGFKGRQGKHQCIWSPRRSTSRGIVPIARNLVTR